MTRRGVLIPRIHRFAALQQRPVRIAPPPVDYGRRLSRLTLAYRILGPAVYRLYRSMGSPPTPASEPFATATSLPATPEVSWPDGVWYLSASYHNGLYDSGFLPLGPAGETWLRLEIAAGVLVKNPPSAPSSVRLERLGSQLRLIAAYEETGDGRGTQWALAWSSESEPPASAPAILRAIPRTGLAVLDYRFTPGVSGTTIRAVLQVRRTDGTVSRYSEAIRVAAAIGTEN